MMKVGFIGFGEAAKAFKTSPTWRGNACAFDTKTRQPSEQKSKRSDYDQCGVEACEDPRDVVAGSEILLSLVTADQAVAAAASVANTAGAGRIYIDFNSVSPGTKIEASQQVSQSGATYVDAAIMAPVYPAQQAVPILLAGAAAGEAVRVLEGMGFSNVSAIGGDIGKAASIKMVRSVFVKGIEAVSAECAIAARKAGVLDEVLESLGEEAASRINYNLERMLVHGDRRAAEMDEVAKTLLEFSVDPLLTVRVAERQRRLGESGRDLSRLPEGLSEKLDLIVGTKGAR